MNKDFRDGQLDDENLQFESCGESSEHERQNLPDRKQDGTPSKNAKANRRSPSFDNWDGQCRRKLGKLGLDLIQALVPAAGLVAVIQPEGWNLISLVLFMGGFVLAAILFFGNVGDEYRSSPAHLKALVGFILIGSLITATGKVLEDASTDAVLWLWAPFLVVLTFASTQLVRWLDGFLIVPENPDEENFDE